MPRQNYVEFTETTFSNLDDGARMTAKKLATPVEELRDKIRTLVIDGVETECDPQTLTLLGRALKRTMELEKRGHFIDCVGFTALMCGGSYPGPPIKAVLSDKVTSKTTYGPVAKISEFDDVGVQTPVLLGRPVRDGSMDFKHAHTILIPDQNLWVEKLGQYDLVLATTDAVAKYYRVNHAAIAYGLEAASGTNVLMTYRSDDVPSDIELTTIEG